MKYGYERNVKMGMEEAAEWEVESVADETEEKLEEDENEEGVQAWRSWESEEKDQVIKGQYSGRKLVICLFGDVLQGI